MSIHIFQEQGILTKSHIFNNRIHYEPYTPEDVYLKDYKMISFITLNIEYAISKQML